MLTMENWNVTIISERGVPIMCEQGDAPASSVWTDTLGKQHYTCQAHNPMYNTAMALPFNFTTRSLCHACGQPVSLGTQQVVYPGTAG
jgi:hypothetical protein